MTETWHEVSFESKVPVDSAGCVYGNIERPAVSRQVTEIQRDKDVDYFEIVSEKGRIRSQDAVDLEAYR